MIKPLLLAVVGLIRQQPTPRWKTMAAWCCWVIRRSVVAIHDGINGVNTRIQRQTKDFGDLFTSDTLKGGEKKPEQMGGSQQDNAGAEGVCQHSDPQSA